MAKRKVVVDLYEEVVVQNLLHTAEIEVDVDLDKDTVGDIESKATTAIELPKHVDERVKDKNDPLTADKIKGRMRL